MSDRAERTAALRSRIEKASLRWQARLDTDWADRSLPWIVAALLFVLFASLALARARSLEAGVDLGLHVQAAWLIGQGSDPTTTVDEGLHFLSQQAGFLFYPLAFATRWLPTIPTLLVVQSAVLAVGVVPLWRIARRLALLRVGAASAVLLAYAAYPAIHNLNANDFHLEVLALPALLGAALHGLSRRWILFGIFATVAVLARADLGLAVAGLGVLFAIEGERRAGVITGLAGLGWTLLAALVMQPVFGDGGYPHIDAFAAYGTTPWGVAWGMLTSPLVVLADLFAEENFALLVFLFAPVLFLPVLAPRYLLPVLPLQVIYLIADVPEEDIFGTQTIGITAFIFLATAMALARAGTMGVERVRVDRRVLGALVLAALIFFVRDADSSPYREPWAWGGRDAVDHARLDVVDLVGEDEAVRATSRIVPLLAEREAIYVLDVQRRPHVRLAAEGVDVVIVDGEETVGWSEEERRLFREGLERQGFERIYNREGVEAFRSTES